MRKCSPIMRHDRRNAFRMSVKLTEDLPVKTRQRESCKLPRFPALLAFFLFIQISCLLLFQQHYPGSVYFPLWYDFSDLDKAFAATPPANQLRLVGSQGNKTQERTSSWELRCSRGMKQSVEQAGTSHISWLCWHHWQACFTETLLQENTWEDRYLTVTADRNKYTNRTWIKCPSVFLIISGNSRHVKLIIS